MGVLASRSGEAVVSFNRSSSAGVTFCTSTTGCPFSSSLFPGHRVDAGWQLAQPESPDGKWLRQIRPLILVIAGQMTRDRHRHVGKALPMRRKCSAPSAPCRADSPFRSSAPPKLRKRGCHAPGSSCGDDGQQCAKCQARRTQPKSPSYRGDKGARHGIRTASLFPFSDTCPIANQQNAEFLRPGLF